MQLLKNDIKKRVIIYCFLFLLTLTACEKELSNEKRIEERETVSSDIPEGHFIATFTSSSGTKSAVSGPDSRIQHLRYIIYKSTGEFIKERFILLPTDPTPNWPLHSITDTLPKGSYRAVFIGNAEKTLFPYPTPSNPVNYNEVLVNYQEHYNDARLVLPNKEFATNTEYYWENIFFSDTDPDQLVLLQRIIGLMNVHRNFVDATEALDTLVANIVTQMHYKDLIQTTASGVLTSEIKEILSPLSITIGLLGGTVDGLTNQILAGLINPVVDNLYAQLIKGLTHQIGLALSGNEDQSGLLAVLGELLNPWESSQAQTSIVDINNFPKSIDLDLNITEYYTGVHSFKIDFNTSAYFQQKCIYIKGFSGLYDIKRINVIKSGLLSGIVFDGIIDSPLLLNGSFIDVNDPLSNQTGINRRYKADYSFTDIRLKSYTAQTDGDHNLTLTVRVGDVANVDGVLGGIPLLNTLLNTITQPIKNINVSVGINLPLLGIDNLTISGGWNTPFTY